MFPPLEFTRAWWLRVLQDPLKLHAWLQKLQLTEIGGGDDHFTFISSHLELTEREVKILTQIADDEYRHSELLVALLDDRGIELKQLGDSGTLSQYWVNMGCVEIEGIPPKDYFAINYYGESLAASRFEIIRSMPETPGDIKAFVDSALPEEIFHRETLFRLVDDETKEKFSQRHKEVLGKMLRLV